MRNHPHFLKLGKELAGFREQKGGVNMLILHWVLTFAGKILEMVGEVAVLSVLLIMFATIWDPFRNWNNASVQPKVYEGYMKRQKEYEAIVIVGFKVAFACAVMDMYLGYLQTLF